MKKAELKKQSDTAQANADAAYKLEEQKRLQEINIAQINADIAKRERQVELGEREVELQQKQLEAAVNKKADAEKYAVEQKAQAELFQRQRAAEAELFELQKQAEAQKIQAEAAKTVKEREAEAKKIEAEAERFASEQKAAGIEAVGQAEAQAIEQKAEAMKKWAKLQFYNLSLIHTSYQILLRQVVNLLLLHIVKLITLLCTVMEIRLNLQVKLLITLHKLFNLSKSH